MEIINYIVCQKETNAKGKRGKGRIRKKGTRKVGRRLPFEEGGQ